MWKFLKYEWDNFKRQQKLDKSKKEMNDMIIEMKTMTSKEMEDKWVNPVKHFTDLKWNIYCAKNDIIKCKKCNKWHKIGVECSGKR